MKVINKNGVEIDFDFAVELMDDDIREELHMVGFDSDQDFFEAYEREHEKHYGEEWELSKENPVY